MSLRKGRWTAEFYLKTKFIYKVPISFPRRALIYGVTYLDSNLTTNMKLIWQFWEFLQMTVPLIGLKPHVPGIISTPQDFVIQRHHWTRYIRKIHLDELSKPNTRCDPAHVLDPWQIFRGARVPSDERSKYVECEFPESFDITGHTKTCRRSRHATVSPDSD
jgi:hypothetical protein